jgi:hypothetical protein
MRYETRQRINRIKIEVQIGTCPGDIMEMLSKDFGISEKRVANLLTVAYAELEEERKRDEEAKEEAMQKEIADWVKRMMLTEQEANTYLSEIIRGVRKEEKVICTPKGAEVVKLVPNMETVLKAYALYRNTLPPVCWTLKDGKYIPGGK